MRGVLVVGAANAGSIVDTGGSGEVAGGGIGMGAGGGVAVAATGGSAGGLGEASGASNDGHSGPVALGASCARACVAAKIAAASTVAATRRGGPRRERREDVR